VLLLFASPVPFEVTHCTYVVFVFFLVLSAISPTEFPVPRVRLRVLQHHFLNTCWFSQVFGTPFFIPKQGLSGFSPPPPHALLANPRVSLPLVP